MLRICIWGRMLPKEKLSPTVHRPHQEHIESTGVVTHEYFALVHQSVPREKVAHIPKAIEALTAEWEKLESKIFAIYSKPRPRKEGGTGPAGGVRAWRAGSGRGRSAAWRGAGLPARGRGRDRGSRLAGTARRIGSTGGTAPGPRGQGAGRWRALATAGAAARRGAENESLAVTGKASRDPLPSCQRGAGSPSLVGPPR